MAALLRSARFGLLALGAAVLVACGGGSSGFGSKTISGVAATGQAISQGSVSLRCASGSAPATQTRADGSFTIDANGAMLPCIVRVAYSDATGTPHALHSLARSTGTVNITPITDMVVAHLSSSGIAANAYDHSETDDYSDSRIQTAMQTVKAKLASLHVDTSKLPSDLLGTALQAAHDTHPGDLQDQALDELHLQLTQTTRTLEQVESEMHDGSEHQLSTSTGTAGDAVAGQLAYATNCAACHGARMPDAINAARILGAIRESEGGMGTLAASVDLAVANNIATYMATQLNNTGAIKTTQTISFAGLGTLTIGSTVTLAATASSALTVSFVSTTPTVCTVSANTLTPLASGTCTVRAEQAGNAVYAMAPAVTRSALVGATAQPAASASNGKILYANNSCGACHGTPPSTMRVLNGANAPGAIRAAITANLGGMGQYSNLSDAQLADIAAYLATPNI